jgi:hypothetical protein
MQVFTHIKLYYFINNDDLLSYADESFQAIALLFHHNRIFP